MNETDKRSTVDPRGTCGWCGTSQKLGAGAALRRHPGLHGTVCDGTGTVPQMTTAPVPRGVCGKCETPQKITRETGLVVRHRGCDGAGTEPTERVVIEDRRRRPTGTPVVPAPDRADMVTREEAAEICQVTIRSVTRWAAAGYLTRYEDSRGRVAYARVQVEAMNRFEPVE